MQTSFVFFLNGRIIKGISLFTFRNWYKFNTCSCNNIIAHQYCHHVFISEIEGALELDCPRYKYERRKRNIDSFKILPMCLWFIRHSSLKHYHHQANYKHHCQSNQISFHDIFWRTNGFSPVVDYKACFKLVLFQVQL